MSSLVSAFYSTGIEELKVLASILHTRREEFASSMLAMSEAKNTVVQNALWLQPRKVKPTFNCLKDMNNYMFVLCVAAEGQ